MKRILLTLFGLLAMSLQSLAQEPVDSVFTPEIEVIALPDSIVSRLATNIAQIDSLSNANKVLKNMLREAQREIDRKDREIASLKGEIDKLRNVTIKRVEASNDTLQRRLISMASNFLYIPYDEYSINRIAIPAFNATKGSPVYDKYRNRLPLLENYKADMISLIEFLSQTEAAIATRKATDTMRQAKAQEQLTLLQSMPVVMNYAKYDDWENTYIGNQIRIITGHLETFIKAAPEKVTSLRDNTIDQLQATRACLEALINNQ